MPNTRQKSFLTRANDRVIARHDAEPLQHDQRGREQQHRAEVDERAITARTAGAPTTKPRRRRRS